MIKYDSIHYLKACIHLIEDMSILTTFALVKDQLLWKDTTAMTTLIK